MINKYMKILYNEVETIRSRLLSEKTYFGDCHIKNPYSAISYIIILKDGTGFSISLGTSCVPKVHKRDIAYICKKCTNSNYSKDRYMDSDIGYYVKTQQQQSDYLISKMNKYKYDSTKEIIGGEE